MDNKNLTKFPLDTFFQGVKRVFVLAFNNTAINVPNDSVNNTNNRVERNSHRKFLFIVCITNYNVLSNERNIYDSLINDQIKYCERTRTLLHNRTFVRLSVLRRSLATNCS